MATDSSILAWRIPMDRGAWWATVQGVQAKSWTRLSNKAQSYTPSIDFFFSHFETTVTNGMKALKIGMLLIWKRYIAINSTF